VQVHERAGLTFSAALRSIMRQDPDVILVGEIRDRETAEIAIQASLTGHLVLSTLHTNDAASAVTRLIDIGVPSYQIATAVKGVIAQRLLRRRCADCAALGCENCSQVGYRGRLAVAEILLASPEFERRVTAGASTESLAEAARASGCITLWQSGLDLVRRGETTMEELRRVAAEPVRLVAEPAGVPGKSRLRIGWRAGKDPVERSLSLANELVAAAAPLGGQVEIIEEESLVPDENLDALVVFGIPDSRDCASSTLLVILARGGSSSDHVHMLGRDADVVVPEGVSARFLLATILALLRWRSR
jgi:hypothetical protein